MVMAASGVRVNNMKEKVALKIVDLIHDITQMGYEVHFCSDFENMVRLEFTEEYNDEFYMHAHLGCPGTERIVLEKAIIEELSYFKEKYKKE